MQQNTNFTAVVVVYAAYLEQVLVLDAVAGQHRQLALPDLMVALAVGWQTLQRSAQHAAPKFLRMRPLASLSCRTSENMD